MKKPESFDDLVRHSTSSADNAVIGQTFRTEAEKIRAAVERALQFAVVNHLIEVKPVKEWPMWLADDGEGWDE